MFDSIAVGNFANVANVAKGVPKRLSAFKTTDRFWMNCKELRELAGRLMVESLDGSCRVSPLQASKCQTDLTLGLFASLKWFRLFLKGSHHSGLATSLQASLSVSIGLMWWLQTMRKILVSQNHVRCRIFGSNHTRSDCKICLTLLRRVLRCRKRGEHPKPSGSC